MNRRRAILTFAALAARPALIHAGPAEPGPTLKPGALTIGTYFVNPPFEYAAGGKRIGFEVDMMEAVSRQIGLEAVFVNTRWEVILRQVRDGRYDCIVGGITITPRRAEVLAWSTPYMTTTLSLIVDERRSPDIRDLAGLKTASVAVQAATTDYDAAMVMKDRGQIGSIKVYPFDRIADAMVDLAAGRVTCVMKVAPVAGWFVRETPGLRIVAQVPDDPQPLGIGFRKDQTQLLGAVNGALAAIKADGRYATLARKWNVP